MATKVEQVTFFILVLLAFGFIFDWKQPILQLKGFSVTSVEVLLLIVISLWLSVQVIAFSERKLFDHPQKSLRHRSHPIRRLAIPMMIWVVVLLAAAVTAPDHQITALKFSIKVISSVLIGWIVFDLTYSIKRQQLVAQTIALSGLTVAIIGVMETANFAPLNAWLTGFRFDSVSFAGVQRISATLVHPNHLAMILELMLPLALAWFLTAQRKWVQVLLGIGLFMEALALVLTLSRGGLIASIAGFGLITVISERYKQRKVALSSLAIIGTLIILAIGTVITNPLLMVRVIGEGNNELWYRAEYQVPNHLSSLPGRTMTIPVTVTNTGLIEWGSDGSEPFNLSYHIILLDTKDTSLDQIQNLANKNYIIYEEGIRTPLPENVSPNNQVKLSAQVIAPSEPGTYVIEWDMLHVYVTWFSKKNVVPALTRLTVRGTPSENAPQKIMSPAEDTSIETPGRLKLWLTAWQMFQDRPLLGVGQNTYQINYSKYAHEEKYAPHAHNLWLGWLAETGILGLLAFLWMTWKLIQIAWRGRYLQQNDISLWVWWLAFLAGITSLLIHGFVDVPYSDASVYLAFWMVAGLVLSAVEVVSDADKEGLKRI